MSEPEDAPAPAPTTTESEGTTTDEDVHLSPTCVCGRGGRGGGGVGGGGRIKLLCSFGGRIAPRASDGALKYVGGETRVLAVPRSIPFCELKKKVEEMFKTEVAAIKYQLISLGEDLDLLVSVTCDEDLVHMLDEYDRLEVKRSPTASPRFRVYVYALAAAPVALAAAPAASSRYSGGGPARQQPLHHHLLHHNSSLQPERYVATVPATPNGSPPFPAQPHGAVSAGNSPRADAVGSKQPVFGLGMQRVRSSPNLGGLDAMPQHLHPHAAADIGGGGGLTGGYMSSSPRHTGAGGLFVQNSYHPYQQQYPPAPMPAPHHGGLPGRYDGRGYVRVGSYLSPMVPAPRQPERPVSRGGPPLHGEMQTPKKAALVWD
ncbi:hypothetical protein ACP4OV_021605 [Aristida adscensionis]